MKSYQCSVCGFIYDEEAGLPDEGIAPGTRWEDVPADWVSFVVKAPKPPYIEPIFTRDPAQISEIQILMAMMAPPAVATLTILSSASE